MENENHLAKKCHRCGHLPRFLNSILDPVSGSKYRIYRCENCGEQTWQEDKRGANAR